MSKPEDTDIFKKLKDQLLMIDPVSFVEKYLTLDGKPFRLTGNGFRPFSDIYRYIGIKALEPDALPVILVKGRQVGGTTMAGALEMYFMGCGLFGVGDRPPIRVIHAFPLLELAAAYSKTKLNQMISSSIILGQDAKDKKQSRPKSYMQSLLDLTSPTNDSIHFKQFVGGNHLWVESTGIDADRIMGRTADVIFFDECYPYHQLIQTENGPVKIGKLHDDFIENKELPLIYSFNETTNQFELKKVINVFNRGKKSVVKINAGQEIICTPNHKYLTYFGWKSVDELSIPELLKSNHKFGIKALNDDQLQVVLGSFLGDGNLFCQRNNRSSSFSLRVIHGAKQNSYCEWKANMLNAKTKIVNNNGYSQKPAIKFVSESFALPLTLSSKKTYCPQWILDNIDARGIAIWFMDDGSITRKWNDNCSGTISTCSFDEDSQIRFVEKFRSLNIECHYKKYDGRFYLLFNKDGMTNLFKLIAPYVHEDMTYKINNTHPDRFKYVWDNKFEDYTYVVVNNIKMLDKQKTVYDIEIEDNHNFVLCSKKNNGGPIAHNCQKTTTLAMGNATKILTTAKYGKVGKGVQVYFGTPRKKGTDFHKMWQASSQQYFHLGCEKCKKHFPLYSPESDSWKDVWIYGFIVRCPHCNFEQDKREAAERGKWVAMKDHREDDCKLIGFHINQLYMPTFTKEDIENEMPGIHPINTERIFRTEVMGEFFQGDTSCITPEEITEKCADVGRRFTSTIEANDKEIVVVGIDYGKRADIEQLARPDSSKVAGQSYSTAVVLRCSGPGILSIEFATKFKRNDMESKKSLIDEIMKKYSVQLAVGDIGFSQDFSEMMHQAYGDKYLVSRAHNKITNYIKFSQDAFPKEIVFERDHYIDELFGQMRKGQVRFPYGDYEKIAWLIDHCCSMEIKPSLSKTGADPTIHYVKGSTPNDGFMALLNAYIAYKFIITSGFTNNNPLLQGMNIDTKNKPLVLTGCITRRF